MCDLWEGRARSPQPPQNNIALKRCDVAAEKRSGRTFFGAFGRVVLRWLPIDKIRQAAAQCPQAQSWLQDRRLLNDNARCATRAIYGVRSAINFRISMHFGVVRSHRVRSAFTECIIDRIQSRNSQVCTSHAERDSGGSFLWFLVSNRCIKNDVATCNRQQASKCKTKYLQKYIVKSLCTW